MAEAYKQFLDRVKSALETDDSVFGKLIKEAYYTEITSLLEDEETCPELELKLIYAVTGLGIADKLFSYCLFFVLQHNVPGHNDSQLQVSPKYLDLLAEKNIFTGEELYEILHNFNDNIVRTILSKIDGTNFNKLYSSYRCKNSKSFLSLISNVNALDYSRILIKELLDYNNDSHIWNNILSNFNFEELYRVSYSKMPAYSTVKKIQSHIYNDMHEIDMTQYNSFMNKYPEAMAELRINMQYLCSYQNLANIDKKELKDTIERYSFIFEDIDNSIIVSDPDYSDVFLHEVYNLINNLLDKIKNSLNVNNNSESPQKHKSDNTTDFRISDEEYKRFITDNFDIDDKAEVNFYNYFWINLLKFIIEKVINKQTFEVLCYLLYPSHTSQNSGEDSFCGKLLQGGFEWKDDPQNIYECAKIICNYFPTLKRFHENDNKFTYIQSKWKDFIVDLVVDSNIKWMETFIEQYWVSRDEKNIEENPRAYVLESIRKKKIQRRD